MSKTPRKYKSKDGTFPKAEPTEIKYQTDTAKTFHRPGKPKPKPEDK